MKSVKPVDCFSSLAATVGVVDSVADLFLLQKQFYLFSIVE